MTAGRPTSYTDDLLGKAREYLTDFESQDEVTPTIAGLSMYIGIARATVYDWASQPEKQEFSDIVEKVMQKQELMLVSSGLKGDFNASITKLALTKHNYSDKTETDNLHTFDFTNQSDEQLKAIIDGKS